MITLTRIDGSKITVNADEIETVESSYDSTITLKSGKKIIVREDADLIVEKVISYRRKIAGTEKDTPGIKKDSSKA